MSGRDPRDATPPPPPRSLALSTALALIDRRFGIRAILSAGDGGATDTFFAEARQGYEQLYGSETCMHLAVNWSPVFDPQGCLTQPDAVTRAIRQTAARRVLELGCGTGYNSLLLAARHPGVQFTGLDRLPRHRDLAAARARDRRLGNARFVAARFEALPEDLGEFDVVFGVETLFYAADPGRVARGIARVLRRGGRFLQFDPFRHEDVEDQPAGMVEAMRLFEAATAMPRGFRPVSAWAGALAGAGLGVSRRRDLTDYVLPGLVHRQQRAVAVLGDGPRRDAAKPLPRTLARSIVQAITAPLVFGGPGPLPMPPLGTLRYSKIEAQKP